MESQWSNVQVCTNSCLGDTIHIIVHVHVHVLYTPKGASLMWYAHGCVNLPLVVGQHWIRSSIACERSLNQNLCPRERERENKERERIYELVLKIKKNSQPSYLLLSSQIHQLLSTFPLPPHTYMCTPTPYIYIHTLACCTYIHNNSQLALSVLNISC